MRANDYNQTPKLNPYTSIQDNDTLIYNYIKQIIKPQITMQDGTTLIVPLIYNGAEKWAQTRKRKFIVDEYGNIRYPLISFSRTSIAYHDPRHVNRIWTNITRHFVSIENKYSKQRPFNLQDANSAGHVTSKPMVQIMIPIDISCRYDFQIYTDSWQDMNSILESFMLYTNRWWILDRHQARIQVMQYSNATQIHQGEQRLIRTQFSIETLGTLLPDVYQPHAVIDDRKITKIKVREL